MITFTQKSRHNRFCFPDPVGRLRLDGHEERPAERRVPEGEQHDGEAAGGGPGRLSAQLLATDAVRPRRGRCRGGRLLLLRGRHCITVCGVSVVTRAKGTPVTILFDTPGDDN